MFAVNTNVAKSDVPAALLSEATEELAKAMGKPVQVGLGSLGSGESVWTSCCSYGSVLFVLL